MNDIKTGIISEKRSRWDQMALYAKLDSLAADLDAAIHANASRTEYSVDPSEIDRVVACLEELSQEVFEYMRDTGQVL